MPDRKVNIVRRGNRVEPENGFRTKVGSQDAITFTVEPGASGQITFAGESPFGVGHQTVSYNTPLRIAVTFSGAETSKVFRYRCKLTIGGQQFESPDEAGGEMEVIRGGSN
jgi:hypothetical protein